MRQTDKRTSIFQRKKRVFNRSVTQIQCYQSYGGGGGSTSVKLFLFFYMLNSKNRVINTYFSISTCPMRKRLLWISRGLNLLSFSMKLFSGHFYGQSFIKTVRGPWHSGDYNGKYSLRGGGGGESTSVKLFLFFYMLNSKNRVINTYFSISTCPMRKRLLWISRGLNLLSFSMKLFSGHFYGQSFIKTVRGPWHSGDYNGKYSLSVKSWKI